MESGNLRHRQSMAPLTIVLRTAADFSAGSLDKVEVVDGTDNATIELTNMLELGDGSDGSLVVDGTNHVDDGTPKQYTSVEIKNGGVVTVAAWAGSSGGRLDWTIQGSLCPVLAT